MEDGRVKQKGSQYNVGLSLTSFYTEFIKWDDVKLSSAENFV